MIVYPNRERYARDNREACEERIPRPEVQRVKHLLAEKRECKAKERAQHRRRGDGGCGVPE